MPSHQVLSRAFKQPVLHHTPRLAFLYSTPTLCRWYSEAANNGKQWGDEELSSSHRRNERQSYGRPFRANDSKSPYARSRSSRQSSTRRTDESGHSYSPKAGDDAVESRAWKPRSPTYSRPSASTYKRTMLDDDVPFDSPEETITSETLNPTTISDNERKAFERLRKLGASKPSTEATASSTKTTDDSSETLDDVLDEAMFKIETERQAPARAEALMEQRYAEFARVVALLKAAKTDIELWHILEKEAFEPVIALNLDDPKEDRAERKGGLTDPTEPPNSREIIMHNFPLLLRKSCSILRRMFPMSSLPQAFIPTIRSMGPSIYALGASTKLYNQIIMYTYRNLTDMDQIADLLEEMENEALEPDQQTYEALDNIMLHWQGVRRGTFGEAARVTWETERFRRSLTTLSQWKSRVQASLQQSEAQKAARQQRASMSQDQFDGDGFPSFSSTSSRF